MLTGIHTALVTPFDADGSLDERCLRKSISFQIDHGAAGLCALGGTGEPLSMTPSEHKRLIDIVVSEVSGQVPVTVGCLLPRFDDIVDIGRHAKSRGADHLMVIAPYFINPTLAHITQHVEQIGAQTRTPLIFFNSPARSGFQFGREEFVEFVLGSEHIVGVKEASADMILFLALLKGQRKGFSVLQGLDELLLPSLAVGGHGGMVSLGELIPDVLCRMYEMVKDGERDKTSEIQFEILELCRFIYAEPNPGPLKYALNLVGRSAGPTRRPIQVPGEVTKNGIRACVASMIEGKAA